MQVLGGHTFDHAHLLSGPGSYEWWYVDAQSDDGEWGIVVIVFRGMPMSPDYLAAVTDPGNHCGYAVSVYHHGARIATAFHGVAEEQCSFSQTDCDVRAGDVSIRRAEDGSYVVHANTHVDTQPQSVRITAVCAPLSAPAGRASEPEPHAWILAAPRLSAKVEVAFVETGVVRAEARWQGMGYHDHNLGVRPMQADHGDWYWGRVHDADRTIVYLATPGATQPCMWVGVADEQGLHSCSDARVSIGRRRFSFMGLHSGRTLTCSGLLPTGEELQISCVNSTVVENGPFYQRYLSDWTVNGIAVSNRGMSEYMDCSRYSQAWIRPFLRTIFQRR